MLIVSKQYPENVPFLSDIPDEKQQCTSWHSCTYSPLAVKLQYESKAGHTLRFWNDQSILE